MAKSTGNIHGSGSEAVQRELCEEDMLEQQDTVHFYEWTEHFFTKQFIMKLLEVEGRHLYRSFTLSNFRQADVEVRK